MRVLMVSKNNFPAEDAGAVREEHFALMYQSLGYRVHNIAMGRVSNEGIYKEISYLSLYQAPSGLVSYLKRLLTIKQRFIQAFERYLTTNGAPSIIHIYDHDPRVIKFLLNYAAKNEILVIHDSVEWYSPCEFKLGQFSPVYLTKEYLNRHLIKKPTRVIAISQFLEAYFSSQNLLTTRIPVVLDLKQIEVKIQKEAAKIHLVYAGSPGRKDYLKELLWAFSCLEATVRQKLHIHLIGINQAQYLALLDGAPGSTDLQQEVSVYGRLPRAQVLALLPDMDFSMLLRPTDERYAMAGFPTKVVEAMSHGVAVVANFSSDLPLYLSDGENSIIIKENSTKSIQAAFERIVSLSPEEIMAMRHQARKTAENSFDYRLYIPNLKALILEN